MPNKLVTFTIAFSFLSTPLFAATQLKPNNSLSTLIAQEKIQQAALKQEQKTIHSLEIKVAQLEKPQSYEIKKTNKTNRKKTKAKTKPSQPPKYEFKINGLINVGAFFVNDGFENNLFFMGNQQYNTRVNFIEIVRPNERWTLTGELQVGLRVNPSNVVSQINGSPATSLRVRKAQVISRGKGVGSFYFGRGDTILFSGVKSDLSGTVVAGNIEVDKIGGGIYMRQFGNANDFVDTQQIRNIFSVVNGYLRRSRFRYDTPAFHGVYLSADVLENSRAEAGLFYRPEFDFAKIAAAATYYNKQVFDITNGTYASGPQYAGTFSILFNCGLNFTGGYWMVDARESGRDNPNMYYAKLGYQAHWFEIGKTAISADYGQFQNEVQNDDRGQSIAADVVQYFPNIKLQVYAGYRHYLLSRTNANFRTVNYGVIGLLYRLGSV